MANTFRLGSTTDSCRAASVARAQLPEETEEKGNMDPDKLLQCPFDKNHQIRVCRFPYHLIKCRKNHPKLASELKTCPFNARHLVPKHELTYHTETCENRISVNSGEDGHCGLQVPVSTWVNPDMTEDWDEEADDVPSKFVWGESRVLTAEERPTNSLGTTIRAPNTFPWLGLKQ
ncbi:putative gametocyte-specific factor 1-like isoform 6 [Scophthalmus maximus]|uniref:Putative gametocyte-specific factor 1-like n=1 Tax=Scophthalmus maximus TaxID=52904 RepID=A0A2U9C2G0_SCOMX|nr:gametocyte-specific factor 1 [Scophthalmus maximus]XP_047187134.1 gametocyte-specific factor 1 [Scophthalmus maximus]XP_047187135.1 gametocyte-specific factor 1 [Scophthalmus maximus]AWP10198.1 putative gametocyte-specific factor 1-like [Scophthalmus maximus]AWP10200.1 putative gametocyte-specific factor 1-like isoform 3 [Scophthalmus maximus]AWP10202.1 putative gametocyte-specific factor 1-like isoform 5 [Scophthalmus maximus]AWP10203.1 putative gametocyte-specific factor 1-like isoform 6